MQKVFSQLSDLCFFYIYVLAHDASKKDHLQYLKLILQNIREAGLKLNVQLALSSREICNISGECIYPLKEKLEKILDIECPRDVTETRHIIGIESYYREFFQPSAILLSPYRTYKKTPQLSTGIHIVKKEVLTNSPILMLPYPNEPYILFTDASKHSCSGVFTQKYITTIKGKDTKSFSQSHLLVENL